MSKSSANVAKVSLSSGLEVCLSYGVAVAAFVPGRGYIRTDRKYSVTTSKHANQFAGHDSTVVPESEFRALIAPVVDNRG